MIGRPTQKHRKVITVKHKIGSNDDSEMVSQFYWFSHTKYTSRPIDNTSNNKIRYAHSISTVIIRIIYKV